jgi:hypothetical protein
MTNECIPMEALGTLEALAPDHPLRRHAATCPRCSSLLFAYAEFARATPVDGANPADADRRLDAFIAREVERHHADPVPVSGAPRRGRGRWFDVPVLRLAAVTAAIVLVAAVVWQWQPWGGDEIVYRSGTGAAGGAITVEAPRALEDGAAELAWSAVAGADVYEVMLLGPDLSELAVIPVRDATSVRVDRARMEGAVYWQVGALREGGLVANSAPEPLPR